MYLMKFDKSSMKSMSVPWIESDFARNILEKKKTSKKLKDQAAFLAGMMGSNVNPHHAYHNLFTTNDAPKKDQDILKNCPKLLSRR